jgi:peptidoglycan/LPS O-acetylase OafA/YrhL
MSKAANRIPSLDGIRAVSIALVIVCHYEQDAIRIDPLDLGSLGVRIFFVISGYLITGLLLKELEQDGHINLLRFYFRRTMRIFPAYYFFLACMLLISSLGWASVSLRQALPALTYTSNYFTPSLWLLKHTWSLSTEEQFYLIWPAALMFSGRRRGLAVLLALLVVAPICGHILSLRLGHEVPAFFNGPIGIGCLLALTRESLYRTQVYRRWIHSQLGLILPFVILPCNLPALHAGGLRDAFFSLVMNIAIAIGLDWAVVHHNGLVGRFLNLRAVVYIGVLSYSVYLWQQPFLSIGTYEHAIYLSGHWKLLTNPFARLAAIATCTLVSYYLVERPMLRLRARLEPRWFARKVPSSAPSIESSLATDVVSTKIV